MMQCKDKEDLCKEYAKKMKKDHGEDIETSTIAARALMVYVPHIYRGGWVIKKFGYSIERIQSGAVTSKNCGNPDFV
jgi:hypothetical protein